VRLSEVLGEARFPLFGLPVTAWPGPAFVGDVVRGGGTVVTVQLVYLDGIDERTMGVVVSNRTARPGESAEDAIRDHLLAFAARFDSGVASVRARSRPLPARDFTVGPATLGVSGETLGAEIHVHRRVPLRIVRTAVRRGSGVTDLGIGGWALDPLEIAGKLSQVDASFARTFDSANEPA
jgi:hypothetical protein